MKTRAKSRTVKLSEMARSGAGPAAATAKRCHICLAPETWEQAPGGPRSNLSEGACRDRQACETRQPPLFGDGDQ